MSHFIEFFVAPDDRRARAVRRRGPRPRYPAVSGASFDADDAIVAWLHLLTGRPGPHEATETQPRAVAEMQNDGSAVFALPDELVAGLADARPDLLLRLAERWTEHELDAGTAAGILAGVARLARQSNEAGHRVYCWVSS